MTGGIRELIQVVVGLPEGFIGLEDLLGAFGHPLFESGVQLADLAFGPFPFRDVPYRRGNQQPFLCLQRAKTDFSRELRSIFSPRSKLFLGAGLRRQTIPLRNKRSNAPVDEFLPLKSEDDFHLRIDQTDLAIFGADDHGIRRRLEQGPEFLFSFAENLRLTLEQSRVAAEFHEHGDLGAQDLRYDGLEQKIHRAKIVTAEQMLLVFVGGEEQDWSVAGTLSRPDELRGLKSVHVRHFHVEENGGKVLFEQMAQRFHAGVGNYQVLSETVERSLQGDEVLRRIIDQEDFSPFIHDGLARERHAGY